MLLKIGKPNVAGGYGTNAKRVPDRSQGRPSRRSRPPYRAGYKPAGRQALRLHGDGLTLNSGIENDQLDGVCALVVAVVPLLYDLDNRVARLDKGDLYITARSGSFTPRKTPRTRGYEAARWRH